MLLATSALLVAIGFIAWLIGEYFDYTAMGTIGGVLIIVVGAGISLTGLEYRSGVTREFAYQTINNSTVVDNSVETTRFDRSSVGEVFGATVIASLGIGGLFMILGTVMMSHSLRLGN